MKQSLQLTTINDAQSPNMNILQALHSSMYPCSPPSPCLHNISNQSALEWNANRHSPTFCEHHHHHQKQFTALHRPKEYIAYTKALKTKRRNLGQQ
ncbi:hypothetical protein KC19_3G012100 [Ceratodon purpureus]|uniref:Uncharacterized protein n=1 Tax=Ceratodon purpureus TaxID=3225 RepID=A0A8T0IG03_CERPU|nr:hypothetical protein KC19_3G012100 [Ceratodon purpureus]